MTEKIGRREQKKIQARQKIMEAAVEQFTENGFQAASVADIMKAADMGLGTFYNYFVSKEDILHCLLDSLGGQLQDHLETLQREKQTQAEILHDMFVRTAQVIDKNRFVLPLFSSAGENCDGQDTEGRNPHAPAFLTLFVKLVKAGQDTGEFRKDVSAELITELFHSLFQAAAFSHLPLSFEENISLKLRVLIDGIKVK